MLRTNAGSDAFEYWNDKNEKYVSPFYESLKHEILSSGYVTLKQWTNKIVFKAQHHLLTEKVKRMNATYPQYNKEGTLISLSHLISIILYCDWSDLCTHFSS
eukprot:758170_1